MTHEPMQRYMIEWSSATGRGNVSAIYPERLNRAQVIARWESAHHGCYVERLNSSKPAEVTA